MATAAQKKTPSADCKARMLAAHVFEHGNVRAAARAMGAPERSARRWAASGAFTEELRRLQADALSHAVRGLSAGAQEATALLRAVIRNPEAPEAVRVRAAVAVIDAVVKLAGYIDLEERIATLEARAEHG